MIQESHSWTYIQEKKRKKKTLLQKETCTPTFTVVSTAYNCQDIETTELSINRWMDKEDPTHTMGYYSGIKKNEIMPSAVTWLQLDITILSEVSQTKTHMISLLYGILKK